MDTLKVRAKFVVELSTRIHLPVLIVYFAIRGSNNAFVQHIYSLSEYLLFFSRCRAADRQFHQLLIQFRQFLLELAPDNILRLDQRVLLEFY